jgi:hypothetical protein
MINYLNVLAVLFVPSGLAGTASMTTIAFLVRFCGFESIYRRITFIEKPALENF